MVSGTIVGRRAEGTPTIVMYLPAELHEREGSSGRDVLRSLSYFVWSRGCIFHAADHARFPNGEPNGRREKLGVM